MLVPFEAAALVIVTDIRQGAGSPGDLLREAFSLTTREAQFAELLCAGHSVESAATYLNITVGTGRLHLHKVFTKTGVSRQVELIALIGKIR